MRRTAPHIVILTCIVAAILIAGCTSSSTSAQPKVTTTPLGPEMTTPAVPVFTTPGFTGSGAETGITVISDDVSGNTSPDAPGIMYNVCPATQPFRCPSGYCARASAECRFAPAVVNCSDGTINCP
jgi:hypothetical protein